MVNWYTLLDFNLLTGKIWFLQCLITIINILNIYVFNLLLILFKSVGFPGSSDVKEFAYNAGDMGLTLGPGRFPWRRKWQPTPVFLPGEFHGQRSLTGYSPGNCKESDTTEQLTLHFTSSLQHHYRFCVFVLLITKVG